MQSRRNWLTWLVLLLGVALRIALAVVIPPERAYDDHYEPVVRILERHELPSAADCWECYQPPAYYVISAGLCGVTQPLAASLGVTPAEMAHIGRRTLQAVSLMAGCATLWLCLLIFRRAAPNARYEPLALAFVAFLPRHIYMSAMATNDALTYFVASAAIWAALRAFAEHWRTKWCLITGLLTGATVLCKGYGWMTVAAILFAVWWHTRRTSLAGTTHTPRFLSRPFALMLCSTLVIAIWPAARNARTYGRPLVDNFDLHDSPMRFQPPGSVANVEFGTFRLAALLEHPWIHERQLRSLPTELFARTWFDYEGFKTTLRLYPPWNERWRQAANAEPVWNERRWEMVLSPSPAEEPADFRRVAQLAYISGFPLTIALIAGLALALRKMWREFGSALIAVHALCAVAVPVVQTLRLPHFAAMKAAFLLGAISSGPVFLGLVLSVTEKRAIRRTIVVVLGIALTSVACSDLWFLALQIRHAVGGP